MPPACHPSTPAAVSWREGLPVACLGVLAYLYLFGPATLNPLNVAWMLQGDPAQHYLGWQFFRNEPWHWPLGRITRLGIPEGTGIVFTDSIPLLALLLKPFSAFLPAEFQYFGLWMLACYLLTGYFALRLLGPFTENRALRIAAASFFLLSPPLLLRGYGHEALMAQWLLLAGIDACLRGWQWPRWFVLVLVAALVHPYLLLMMLGLLCAANLQAGLVEPGGLMKRARQNAVILAGLVVVLFAAGHVGIKGSLAGEGYGFFSMNLAALVDSETEPNFGHARLVPDIPAATQGQYEGFLYLGGGMILLGVLAIGLMLARIGPAAPARATPVWPLIAVAAVFWLLALSNEITFARWHLFTVPLPSALLDLLSIFRASGRLGWPAFYLVTLGILVVIVRRLPARVALGALLAALLLQVVDLGSHYRGLRKAIEARTHWVTPLQSPQWQSLAAGADRLLILPPHPRMEDLYIPFAHLAAAHGLATNAAHTARVEPARIEADGRGLGASLAHGGYDPRTLYVMPQREGLAHVPPALAGRLLELDGYHVLPPGLAFPIPAR
jgi:hypothetical protein